MRLRKLLDMFKRREKSIVKQNLELMDSTRVGGMGYVLGRESIGGNAGYQNDMPCVAVNFRYDKEGRICRFVTADLNGAEMPNAAFTILAGNSRIIRVRFSATGLARQNLGKTVEEYNKRQGEEMPD
jgi:hypothetical protein